MSLFFIASPRTRLGSVIEKVESSKRCTLKFLKWAWEQIEQSQSQMNDNNERTQTVDNELQKFWAFVELQHLAFSIQQI